MKQRLLPIILVMALVCSMSACGCKHEWKEATCTSPKTCKLCEATEGDVIAHEWSEANCTTPKTCKLCELTEGDAKGHNLVEANYQQGEHCADCGEVLGDPLVAEFVRTGRNYQTLNLTDAHGNTHDYTTGQNNGSIALCDVTVRWAVPVEPELNSNSTALRCYVPEGIRPWTVSVENLNDLMENCEGYTWRGIHSIVRIRFSEPGNLIWGYEDFYDLTQYDKDAFHDTYSDGSKDYMITTSAFSVNMNGEIYDQCQLVCFGWGRDSGVELVTFYRVPDDYDGCVFSFIDSRVLENSGVEVPEGFTTYDNAGHGAGDIYFRLR